MPFPLFFNHVPAIKMVDPLADMLGASSEGIFHYTYSDVVKLAGHSCPTVAGAYLMVRKGLSVLHGDDIPKRGNIRIHMSGKLGEGVVGVMANVASMITGATDIGGFHGLAGQFDRRNLLFFEAQFDGEISMERIDTGEKVALTYNPTFVPGNPQMAAWMKMILSNEADDQIRESFRLAWQERVKKIVIDFREDPRLITSQLL